MGGLRGSNMGAYMSLLLLSASPVVVLSHCKRNAFEKADTGEERAGVKNFKATETIVRQRSLPCVCTSRGRRRDASTRERARPPLWLPSSFSFSYFFSLSSRDCLPLSAARETERTDGERRKHTGEMHTVSLVRKRRKSIYTIKERPDVLRRWGGRRDGTEFIDFTSVLLTSPSARKRWL